jgi:hypothetical protein
MIIQSAVSRELRTGNVDLGRSDDSEHGKNSLPAFGLGESRGSGLK